MTRGIPFLALLTTTTAASAWAAPPLTLRQTVEQARAGYPSVQEAQQRLSAAAAGIRLARTAYLPRTDFLAQANRATHNNVFGMLLPQPVAVLPSISGPVLPNYDNTNVWGTAIGALVTWEPFDFGQRRASVEAAAASERRSAAALARTQFEVSVAAADAFLTALAAERTIAAAQAAVDRSRIVHDIAGALAQSGLRPGADASRARAELALAETQVIQARQSAAMARASLAQFLDPGLAASPLSPGNLTALPADTPPTPAPLDRNPVAAEQSAAVDEAKARERALDRLNFPKFAVQASSYARGTGGRFDGTSVGWASGLAPNVQNWGLGMSVTFSALDYIGLRARREIESHREQAEEARYRRVLLELKTQQDRALAQLEGARQVAAQIPVQLAAARDAERQAGARYKAGLGTLVEVAEAQRLLTQIEIDEALSKLAVWRAWLGVAATAGDLAPLLEKAGQ